MAVTESEFNSEDFYLCQLFGEDSRFVEFTNMTGRYIRLSGRLELENLANMAWTTSIVLGPGEKHPWRFLGGRRDDETSTLSLLPDPYFLARENKFEWRAEFVDNSEEEEVLSLNTAPGPLDLRTLPELGPREKLRLSVRRKKSPVTSLRKLAADTLVISGAMSSQEQISELNIPRCVSAKFRVYIIVNTMM